MKKKWVQWVDRPENKDWKKRGLRLPDPWGEWYEYSDPTPVPYPRKCKLTGIIVRDEKEELGHLKEYICSTNLRTFPLYLDSDHWKPLSRKELKKLATSMT